MNTSLHRAGVPLAGLLSALVLVGCLEADPSSPEAPGPALAPGQTREIELVHRRFDVAGVEQRLDLEGLAALPPEVLASVWLLDLDLEPLSRNALQRLAELSSEEAAALSVPAQNLRRLLTMTPDNAELAGTSLEELIGLSSAVGIPPARALADLMTIGITDPLLSADTAAEVIVDQLVATHPNAQTRPGPIDDEHPEGVYPVAPGAIPITLADIVDNFAGLAGRFGPVDGHPGVILEASDLRVTQEDFLLRVKVSANPLPFPGVDLTDVSEGAVNSISGQIDTLFDFDDPNWLDITGLEPTPTIGRLSLSLTENDAFVPGGVSRVPAGRGDSPAWSLPPWEFESIIIEAARRQSATVTPHCDTYELGTGVTAFEACVAEDRWTELTTFADIGAPPDPAYLWDLVLEIAQVRLHDGGLAEGEADAILPLEDVPLGIAPEQLVGQARANLDGNPEALRELARALLDNGRGRPDFFYVRVDPERDPANAGDWLYFVDALDRSPYGYATPGFFADPALGQAISAPTPVDGDDRHLKVRAVPGDTFYLADDDDVVFRVDVLDKPSTRRLRLAVTRQP